MKNIRRFIFVVNFIFVYIAGFASDSGIRILNRSSDSLAVECHFELAQNSETARSAPSYIQNEYTFWVLSKSTVQTDEISRELLPANHPYPLPLNDIPIGLDNTDELSGISNGLSGQPVQIELMGKFHDLQVYKIQIVACSQLALNPHPVFLQSIRLRILGQNIQIVESPSLRAQIIQELTQTKILKKSTIPTDLSENQKSPRKLKIWITEEGMYILPHSAIVHAGWTNISQINPDNLHLSCQGAEVPIHIVGVEDGSFDFTDFIEFYGEPIWNTDRPGEKRKHIYTNQNIYWLELSERPGLRYGIEQVEGNHKGAILTRSYPYTMHIEENLFFHRLPYAMVIDETDYWYHAGNILGSEQRQLRFELQEPDLYSLQLADFDIKLRGQTQTFSEQTVEIFINDRLLGSSTWRERQGIRLQGLTFSPSYLNPNRNILSIVNKSQDEALSQVNLDWFEITYPRMYEPDNNYIRFGASSYQQKRWVQFSVDSFSQKDLSLYRLNKSILTGFEIIQQVDTAGIESYDLKFADFVDDAESEYLAVASEAKKLPDSLQYVDFFNLKQSGLGADYVIITAADSLGNELLAPLIDLRASQGLKSIILTRDTIYNEFNDGIPDPKALQLFMQYAYQNWNPRPQYLLLIGDGHVDSADSTALLPVNLFQTEKYGAAPSDYFYSLLEGNDILPEISVGRLPVQNKMELENVVQKIVNYENSPPDIWKNHCLLIGSDPVFRVQTEEIIQYTLNPSLSPQRLFLQGSLIDPYVGGTEDFLRKLEDGLAWVNFRGHGGGAIWADAGLLDLDDIALIENSGKLPFITSMTCFTGDFASNRPCLGEALIKMEENGAVAFWGSTGVGWTYSDYYLLTEFILIINEIPEITLGEAIRRAKTGFLLSHSDNIAISDVFQYTLLGDPALRLPFPKEKAKVQIPQRSINPGEALVIDLGNSGKATHFQAELSSGDKNALRTFAEELGSNNKQIEVTIPGSISQAVRGVRTVLWNEETGYFANQYSNISIASTYIDSISIEKDNLDISINAIIQDSDTIKHAYCFITSPISDSLAMNMTRETHYRTKNINDLFSPGTFIKCYIKVIDNQDIVTLSDTVALQFPRLPDFRIAGMQYSGEDRVLIEADILNYGGEASNVTVAFRSDKNGFIGSDTVDVGENLSAVASIPINPSAGTHVWSASVNPDSSIVENNYGNNRYQQSLNTNLFNISQVKGSFYADSSGIISFDSILKIHIPENAIPKTSSLSVVQKFAGDRAAPYPIYYVDLLNIKTTPKLMKNMTLQFQNVHIDSHQIVKPYHRTLETDEWCISEYTLHSDTFTVYTRETGYFTLKKIDDFTPPVIELMISDQFYYDWIYISRQPFFQISIKDPSGINMNKGNLQIKLDDVLQDESMIYIPSKSQNAREIRLSFHPELSSGSHSLSISASDIHGNIQGPNYYYFKVSEKFEMRFLGNHPNPFRRETTFVYLLTEAAKEVNLKIYTVSGKLIRSYNDASLAASDYHEVEWDGMDTWDQEVANGVYFFKLECRQINGQMQSIQGKIAKIR